MSVRRTGGSRPPGGSSSVGSSGGVGGASSARGTEGTSSPESASGGDHSLRAGAAEFIKNIRGTGAIGFDRHRQELAQGVLKYFGEMLDEDPEIFREFIAGTPQQEEGGASQQESEEGAGGDQGDEEPIS